MDSIVPEEHPSYKKGSSQLITPVTEEENQVVRRSCSGCQKPDEKATFFCQEHMVFLCHDCFHGVVTERNPESVVDCHEINSD